MHRQVASKPHARVRTVAQRRFDLEKQIRAAIASDPRMALTESAQVRERMKLLRKRAGMKQYEVAAALDEAPRTYQSWENAEVETDRKNYEKVAKFFSRRLKEKVTANWILFGQDHPPAVQTPESPLGSLNSIQLNRIEETQKNIERKLDDALSRPTPPPEFQEALELLRQLAAVGPSRRPAGGGSRKAGGASPG